MDWEYHELLEKIDDDKFVEIYLACSRKIRNMLEGIYLKKRKKGRKVSLKAGKNKAKAALSVRNGIVDAAEEQMAEEIFKTWLYARRDLLKAALDFFEIENEDGITESDLDDLEQAPVEKLVSLREKLVVDGIELKDLAIYLAFMKVENMQDDPELMSVFK